jgi:hypothetical protein
MTFMRVLPGPALLLNLITRVVGLQLRTPKLKMARFCLQLENTTFCVLGTRQLQYKRTALLVKVSESEDRNDSWFEYSALGRAGLTFRS